MGEVDPLDAIPNGCATDDVSRLTISGFAQRRMPRVATWARNRWIDSSALLHSVHDSIVHGATSAEVRVLAATPRPLRLLAATACSLTRLSFRTGAFAVNASISATCLPVRLTALTVGILSTSALEVASIASDVCNTAYAVSVRHGVRPIQYVGAVAVDSAGSSVAQVARVLTRYAFHPVRDALDWVTLGAHPTTSGGQVIARADLSGDAPSCTVRYTEPNLPSAFFSSRVYNYTDLSLQVLDEDLEVNEGQATPRETRGRRRGIDVGKRLRMELGYPEATAANKSIVATRAFRECNGPNVRVHDLSLMVEWAIFAAFTPNEQEVNASMRFDSRRAITRRNALRAAKYVPRYRCLTWLPMCLQPTAPAPGF